MIPKIIHYCWFGNNELDDLSNYCIKTWKKFLPDYKIIKWNESNFNVQKNNYVSEAYNQKKWAFVSDYVRAFALYEYGGIYLDTDVEVKENFDSFLEHGAFSGFEMKGYPFTAVWGTKKNHSWPKIVLDYYNEQTFTLVTNTNIVSNILEEYYHVNKNLDRVQELKDDIFIYPSSTFCIDLPKNYACHHFNGSWEKNIAGSYKDMMTFLYYEEQYYNTKVRGKKINLQEKIVERIKLKYLIKELINRILHKIGFK